MNNNQIFEQVLAMCKPDIIGKLMFAFRCCFSLETRKTIIHEMAFRNRIVRVCNCAIELDLANQGIPKEKQIEIVSQRLRMRKGAVASTYGEIKLFYKLRQKLPFKRP